MTGACIRTPRVSNADAYRRSIVADSGDSQPVRAWWRDEYAVWIGGGFAFTGDLDAWAVDDLHPPWLQRDRIRGREAGRPDMIDSDDFTSRADGFGHHRVAI